MSLDEKVKPLKEHSLSALDGTRLKIERYSYITLPKGSFTRVIELDQTRSFHNGREEIYCRIRQIPYKGLGSCAFPYRAVSYAWSEQPKLIEKLWIADEPGAYLPITIEVKQMLGVFMYGLPYKKTTRLWLDAVSINQADDSEKAQQVEKMGDIYSNADKVLVWLGISPELSKDLGYMSQLFEHSKTATDLDHDTKKQLKELCKSLLSLPWFERRWVIQEVVCAKEATIFLDSIRLDFSLILEVFGYFSGAELETTSRYEAWRSISSLLLVIKSSKETKDSSFLNNFSLEILDTFRDAQCSDDRDRIFAFAGIGILRGMMEVNYSTSTEDVYIEFARAMLRCWLGVGGTPLWELIVLQYACAYPSTTPKALPSWVPDWRNTQQFRRLPHIWDFSKKMRVEPRCHNFEFHDGNKLLLQGFIEGHIRSVLTAKVPRRCDYSQTQDWEIAMATYLGEAWDIVMPASTIEWLRDYKIPHQDPLDPIPYHAKLATALIPSFLSVLSANSSGFTKKNWATEPSSDLDGRWDKTPGHKEALDILTQFAHDTFLKDSKSILPLRREEKSKEIKTKEHAILIERLSVIQAVMEGRSFIVTNHGLMGVASSRCQVGDLICSFVGSHHSFVVRSHEEVEIEGKAVVRLVSDAYVMGITQYCFAWTDVKREFYVV